MMTLTYVGMVFSAMDTDYFPRLSGIKNLGVTFNTTVNRQIEMMFLLVSPMLVAFIIFLPVILPLLYSGKFLPVLGMSQVVVLAMYFRALEIPIEYITLARGDSKSYLLIQGIYAILFVGLVILGFNCLGLVGAGVGVTSTTVIYFVFMLFFARSRYGFHLSSSVGVYIAVQLPLGLLAYAVTFIHNPLVYWSLGLVLSAVSTAISLNIIRKRTNLWDKFRERFKSKLPKHGK